MNYSNDSVSSRRKEDIKKIILSRRKHKVGRVVLQVISSLILASILGFILVVLMWLNNFTSSIDYTVLDDFKFKGERITLYDKNSEVFKVFYEYEDTQYTPIEQFRPDYLNYFISIEDIRFYQHSGIDIKGIFRAVVANLQNKSLSQGASTITQQLIRSQVLTTKKTFERKLTEMFLAIELENRLSKNQILEQYLNTVYFGYGNYGIQSASNFYYGKNFNDLTLSQLCSIIPIIQSPNNFNPVNNMVLNNEKRLTILRSLYDNGYIDDITYNKAVTDYSYQDVKMSREEYNANVTEVNGYYLESAYEQVIEDLMLKDNLTREEAISTLKKCGAEIYTYYDKEVDNALNQIALSRAYAIDNEIQTAVVILDNEGRVVGILGGYDSKPTNYSFNRATQSVRQPGSTFKPIVSYVPALEYLNYTPNTMVTDAKRTYNTISGPYSPNNYNNKYLGVIDLYKALSLSINSVAVDTLHKVSIDRAFKFAHDLGITTLVESRNGYTDRGLAMALGGITDGVKPMEMAVAYNTFKTTNRMKPKFYSRVVDSSGNVLLDTTTLPEYEPKPIITTQSALYVTDMLIDVVQNGTGRKLKSSKVPIAGKTGTTNDEKDLWFVGYTPDYTISLWYGYDTPKKINTGTLHLDLFNLIVQKLYEVHPTSQLSLFTTKGELTDVKHKQYFKIEGGTTNEKP